MACQDRPTTAYRRRILEEFLSCGICKKPYRRPKILPCHHYFCQECLQVRHEQWLETCERAERQSHFRCPDCDHPVIVPTEGIPALRTNHPIANLCEEFSKKTLLTPADTKVGGQRNKCSFHPLKDIELYCLRCKVPVCTACISSAHSGHQVKGVEQAAAEINANIRAQLNIGEQKEEAFSTFRREIQNVQKELKDNMAKTQQEINQACEVQVKKIEDQRDKLLDIVEKTFLKNMADLEEQNDQVLTQLAELTRVRERTEQIMEQEQGLWLSQDLNLAQTLKEKFQNAQTPEICETTLCHFEANKDDGLVIELGRVTSKSMSHMQVLVHTKETNYGQVRSTKVRPIRVRHPWVRKVRFGGRGSGRGKFNSPLGVAVSQDNEVYIAGCWDSRIQVFTMDGVYIREFTTNLPGDTGKKFKPHGVAVDRNDILWVVGDDHVVQYSREGTCLAKIDLPHYIHFRGITVAMATEQVIVTKYDGHNC